MKSRELFYLLFKFIYTTSQLPLTSNLFPIKPIEKKKKELCESELHVLTFTFVVVVEETSYIEPILM